MSEAKITYLIVVGILGPLVIWWLRSSIGKVRDKRKQGLRRRRGLRTVFARTPLGKSERKERQQATLERIDTRFSIIQNALVTALGMGWVVLLMLPLLDYIPATAVSVFVGSSAVVIGIAAKPVIENFIAGIVISLAKPFRIGDTVLIDNAHYGRVEDITTVNTIVKTWEWKRYVIPNSKMIAKEFVNYTLGDSYILTKVEFWVAYDTDLDKLKAWAMEAAHSSEYAKDFDAPKFWISKMEKEGFCCWLGVWADGPADSWELGNDVRTALIKKFKEKGIRGHSFNVLSEQMHAKQQAVYS